jgi:hypothetical protein
VAHVPAGEPFTERQLADIKRAVTIAATETGLRFAVHVGALGEQPRSRAVALHAELGADAPSSVLVAVDPGERQLEVVTGATARRDLDDYACGLGAMAMTAQFGAGDLTGGLVNGLRTLAEHARHPRVLHQDQP